MTATAVRPTPPRKASTLLGPLAVVVAGFVIGAGLAGILSGVLWGLIAGVSVVFGLRVAGVETSAFEKAVLIAGLAVSTFLTRQVLATMPPAVTPGLAVTLGAVWLVSGAAVALVIQRHQRVTMGINAAAIWATAGVLVAPMAVTFGFLDPGAESLGVTTHVVVSAIIGILGGSATLSGVTGVRAIGIGAVLVAITWFAAAQVGFTIPGLIDNIANIVNVPNFWPPDFGWAVGGGEWWWLPSWEFGAPTRPSPLLETFRIAIIASLIGCAVALPVAFMASKVTAPNRLTYLLDKAFMNLIRTVPDLFWAMLFVAAVSVGPLAGVLALIFFSLAIMSKLLSETIDSVDPGPLEAARATGGSHFPAVRVSVLPQVLPNYVAYALYIFEINIRASVVLGLVGAGGIGRVLEAQRSFFRFDRVLAVVILIFVIVFVIEQVSVALRRRLV